MPGNERTAKVEHENKIRCVNYLIEMIKKYGAEILDEKHKDDLVDKNESCHKA